MRICPIRDDNRSVSSRGSNSEYEIWRRWEDCLWFQEELEMEYDRMARQKRKRLAAGKGVKKNGVYLKGDQAASFESLPNGPDPNSVQRDIHNLVPKLTKKGTLFRASQATVDQRHRELQACIDGLFQDDVPALIQELRESRKVTDFFGYWRRDFDLAMKHQKNKNPEKQPRNSISSSIFNQYFSASNTSLAATDSQSSAPHRGRSLSTTPPPSIARVAPSPRQLASAPSRSMLRTLDLSSSDEEFGHGYSQGSRRGSEASNTSSGPPSPPATPHVNDLPHIVVHEIPVVFGHNPASDRGLQPLPEDEEFSSSLSTMKRSDDPTISRSSQRKAYSQNPGNRNAHVFSSDDFEEHTVDVQFNRLSWQTTTSTATTNPASYLADLGTDLTLPKTEDDLSRFPRMSIASFATFMTDSSADAINPLSSRLGYRRSHSAESRRSTTPSTLGQSWSDGEDDETGSKVLLDAFFSGMYIFIVGPTNPNMSPADAFPSAVAEDRPETPVGEPLSSISTSSMASQPPPTAVELSRTDESVRFPSMVPEDRPETPFTELPYLRPETPVGELPSNASLYSSTSGYSRRTLRTFRVSTTSHTSNATGTSSDTSSIIETTGQISVKVVHNHSIILLRIHRTTSFEEMRSKVYDKFVHQENAPLSESFALAYLPPLPFDHRARSDSITSTGFPELARMRFVSSQSEWDRVVASAGRGKLTLRAIGDRGM